MKAYVAVDLGASSGRVILGTLEDGKLHLKEIHRFLNGASFKNGHLVWDLEGLQTEILAGLKKLNALPYEIKSMGIDSWAVDYVLLNEQGKRLSVPYSYRDERTAGLIEQISEQKISASDLYQLTGIQRQPFNTIYQLYAQAQQEAEVLEQARHFLMIPDYLNYSLTGVMKNEFTNASTTQLLNQATHDYDPKLLASLGLKQELFFRPELPGTLCGSFTREIEKKVGFNTEVVLVASHDTASAVLATPFEHEDSIFLSSGTWSLIGTELRKPELSEASRQLNFTNEGGYDYTVRYLKNIMGMWVLQNLRKETVHNYSFDEQYDLARAGVDYHETVDINDPIFLAPQSMHKAFSEYCKAHGLRAPTSESEFFNCAYQSLSDSYKQAADELEQVLGRHFDTINIVGGGCQDKLLNSLIARKTGKRVLTGPIEATAAGNICAQLIRDGEIKDLTEARELIRQSFDVQQVTA
ncbi:MAG: rhamnulokinase [Succinivibrio sp.]|nr:rhamnulokinase [Succinivibrio sp.]